MDFAPIVLRLEAAKERLESGDPRGALEEAGIIGTAVAAHKAARHGIVNAIIAHGARTLANKLRGGPGAKPANAIPAPPDLHQQGQAAIKASSDVHKMTKSAKIDPAHKLAALHGTIKQHQAMIGKLSRVANQAKASGNHAGAVWAQSALATHNAHRDWAMKNASALSKSLHGQPQLGRPPAAAIQASRPRAAWFQPGGQSHYAGGHAAPSPQQVSTQQGAHQQVISPQRAPANPVQPPMSHPPASQPAPQSSPSGLKPGYGAPPPVAARPTSGAVQRLRKPRQKAVGAAEETYLDTLKAIVG